MATETEIEAMARIVDRPRDIAADAIAALDRVRADDARDTEPATAKLQAAIDKAYSAMNGSQYVGGPSERDAWRTAFGALSEVVTQHKGQGEFLVPTRTQEASDGT